MFKLAVAAEQSVPEPYNLGKHQKHLLETGYKTIFKKKLYYGRSKNVHYIDEVFVIFSV